MTNTTKFKVAICGAGIGGLTTAVALSKCPEIEVEVFEAASQLGEVGAGVGIFPRPWEVIRLLDLEEELLKHSEAKRTDGLNTMFTYRKSDQAEGLEFFDLKMKGNLMAFHRADFQKVLLNRLPAACRIHCSKRLKSYTQNGLSSGPNSIELFFEDGSSSTCDVLLGADGLKSAVRKSWVAEQTGSGLGVDGILDLADPVWSGTTAYRALIPAEKLRVRAPQHRSLTQFTKFLGKNGFVITYPISHGKLINFAAFTARHDLENSKFDGPWMCPVNKSEFAPYFEHWEPDVQELFEVVDTALRWAVHVTRPLPSFVSRNVALLGDAAHAMTPHQGSGAGQALEDAYTLATLLSHPSVTRSTIHTALTVYDEIRRPASQEAATRTRLSGRYITFADDLSSSFWQKGRAEQLEELRAIGMAVEKNWVWAWTTSVQDDVERALIRLEESLTASRSSL
ncbi:FAD/NAD(P)-binding domain-containing protein [Pluteus cervinus]|uniref:FAD/NAD(P)-binding domain-containing protein n=1 Tax=Pluteus cervinus TaxID=181527 RepID=A0ACD3AGD8_9AGAR|nr:FAD/NAD(P)-binding domain-containing protein [Pluteus cervinus]